MAFVLQWALLVVLALVVVALARQVGTLHLRLGPRGALEIDDEGPVLGEAPVPAPAHDATGATVMLGGPGPDRVVLFSSPTCGVCKEVAPALAPAAAAVGHAALVLHDPDAERAWNVPGTPFAVVLDTAGIVRAKGTVNNLEQIEGLLDTARARAEEAA
jgi:thiol-disulfide isomerase/thioredoxin